MRETQTTQHARNVLVFVLHSAQKAQQHRHQARPHVDYCLFTFLSQAYGVVWKAIEKRTRQVLALKKCFDAFRNATDAQRTFREIMYLQALAGHDNLIRLQHVVKAENGRDIYLTFDHMGEDSALCLSPKTRCIIVDKHVMYVCLPRVLSGISTLVEFHLVGSVTAPPPASSHGRRKYSQPTMACI